MASVDDDGLTNGLPLVGAGDLEVWNGPRLVIRIVNRPPPFGGLRLLELLCPAVIKHQNLRADRKIDNLDDVGWV